MHTGAVCCATSRRFETSRRTRTTPRSGRARHASAMPKGARAHNRRRNPPSSKTAAAESAAVYVDEAAGLPRPASKTNDDDLVDDLVDDDAPAAAPAAAPAPPPAPIAPSPPSPPKKKPAAPSPPKPPNPPSSGPDVGLGMGRAMIAMQLFESAKKKYAALDETSPDYATQLEQTHRETAAECLKLAQTNGGIYNKAAQFVASLQGGAGDAGIPKAYVETLAVLTDKAPFHPFDVMDECFAEEFGVSATEAFASVDEVPIAAASLAQVHRAVTKDGTEVAVKMQYPWLRRHLASDFAVFDMFAQQIKPGGFDLSWVVKDFQVALTAELDFEGEARNAERCAEDLKHRVDVLVPDVIRAFTSTRVLTTRFVPNMTRCNDPGELAAAGFSPRRVGAAIASVFAEMTFVHGHVHGDPHAGNVYVIPRERRRSDDGDDESMTETTHDASYTLKGRNPKRFSRHDAASRHDGGVPPTIVLLDHGLYHDISPALRSDFCKLVMACVRRDAARTTARSKRFAGESGRRPSVLPARAVAVVRLRREHHRRGRQGGGEGRAAAERHAQGHREFPRRVARRDERHEHARRVALVGIYARHLERHRVPGEFASARVRQVRDVRVGVPGGAARGDRARRRRAGRVRGVGARRGGFRVVAGGGVEVGHLHARAARAAARDDGGDDRRAGDEARDERQRAVGVRDGGGERGVEQGHGARGDGDVMMI